MAKEAKNPNTFSAMRVRLAVQRANFWTKIGAAGALVPKVTGVGGALVTAGDAGLGQWDDDTELGLGTGDKVTRATVRGASAAAGGVAGGALGAKGGAFVGGAIGSFIAPGPGTVIGAGVGALIGGVAGAWGGGSAGSAVGASIARRIKIW